MKTDLNLFLKHRVDSDEQQGEEKKKKKKISGRKKSIQRKTYRDQNRGERRLWPTNAIKHSLQQGEAKLCLPSSKRTN